MFIIHYKLHYWINDFERYVLGTDTRYYMYVAIESIKSKASQNIATYCSSHEKTTTTNNIEGLATLSVLAVSYVLHLMRFYIIAITSKRSRENMRPTKNGMQFNNIVQSTLPYPSRQCPLYLEPFRIIIPM